MKSRLSGLFGVALVIAITLAPGTGGGAVNAATAVPTVTVSKTAGLVDGDTVTVTVRSVDGVPVSSARAQLCKAGVDYPSGPVLPAAFFSDGANCPGPSHPISTSATQTLVIDTNTLANAASPDGETFLYQVGSGVVNWSNGATGESETMTCDSTSPCALVVYLAYNASPADPVQWKAFVFTMTYGDSDPIAGCGGPAAGALNTGGADRMADAFVAWTLGACAQPGAHGAPTRASFVGEGNAVQSFSMGALDLAYTAGGYDDAMNFVPPIDATAPNGGRRTAVAVPIGLNAAVLAVGGGRNIDNSHKVPYQTVKLTDAEVAAFLGGGQQALVDKQAAILQRNPELAQTDLFDVNAGLNTTAPRAAGAYADAESSSWYMTSFLEQTAPDDWNVPDVASFGADRGRARGTDAALALADPSFSETTVLVSGRPALRKGLCCPTAVSQGGIWVFTDLVTAKALGLTPVQVQNADPTETFVAPTSDSLLAALPSMHEDATGVLVSDPTVTSSAGPIPYPMTMVEYALVPTEPLLNDDCSARTASQQLLHDWLAYLTSDAGQALLPAGMVPLPPELRVQAAERIQQVGAAPVTGNCATAPSVGSGDVNAGNAGSTPPARRVTAGSPRPGVTVSSAPSAPGAGPSSASSAPDQVVAVPAFAGRSNSNSTSAVVALLGLMGLTSAVALASSKFR